MKFENPDLFSRDRSFCLELIVSAFVSLTICSGYGQTSELPLPIAEDGGGGYFPTLVDSALLRGSIDSRSGGQGLAYEQGPDLRAQIGSGLFEYNDVEPNFYQKHDDFFRPLDQVLGVFTPHDAITYEADSLDNTSITLDAQLGILTRRFSPDLAMVKAGPLFFDLLWVGAGALYSDFQGARRFRPGDDSGWISYIDVGFRGVVRFTDTIYLSAVGNLMYLPLENRVGLRFGSGREQGLLARMQWSESFGPWNILLYDEFRGRPGLNWWGQARSGARDREGRYFFGFQDGGRTNEFYDDRFVRVTNQIGLTANRLVFGGQWRFWLDIDHTDFWRQWAFDNHGSRQHVSLALGYEGSMLPFAPRLTYDMFSNTKLNSLVHTTLLSLTGRVTENLDWIARGGYYFTTGTRAERQRYLWELGLDHTIAKNTVHWIRIGERFFENEFQAEMLTARYLRWGINQRFGSKFYARGFVQLSDRETLNPALAVKDRMAFGLDLNLQPLDFSQIRASFLYEQTEVRAPLNDTDRWIYRIEWIQQLGMRLTGHLYYQYEERQRIPRSFSEHLVGMSVRRYF